MGQITVKMLYKLAKKEINQGNGDRFIVISNDNEGNGFHGLFYGFCSHDLEEYKNDIDDSETYDTDEIILLG